MKTIDALGKPCPIPVIEAKKALAGPDGAGVRIRVDNLVAVQNLEKMAAGNGYGFSYAEISAGCFEAVILKDKNAPPPPPAEAPRPPAAGEAQPQSLVVAVGKNSMGEGSDELGKILIKGFLYSLTELPVPPAYLIFFNSGVHLTAEGANTLEDLKKLEQKGTAILSCGTCVNYYKLPEKPAVGSITDMYGITEKMAAAGKTIHI